jgi:hypothetical protein
VRSQTEENAINRVLRSWGMGSLGEPGVVAQFASLVDDHAHFMKLLRACEPHQRRDMYEAMAPNLRFPAKPLEDYMVEAKAHAAAAEYPTLDEQGNLHQYYPPEVNTASWRPDQDVIDTAVNAIEALSARGYLEVTCRKCTKTARFYGQNKAEGIFKAREAGWAYDEITGKETCPECNVPPLERSWYEARLECSRCGVQVLFMAHSPYEGIRSARNAGWRYDDSPLAGHLCLGCAESDSAG